MGDVINFTEGCLRLSKKLLDAEARKARADMGFLSPIGAAVSAQLIRQAMRDEMMAEYLAHEMQCTKDKKRCEECRWHGIRMRQWIANELPWPDEGRLV